MLLSVAAYCLGTAQAAGAAVVPSVTFASQPSVQYVPIRSTAALLGVPVEWSLEGGTNIGEAQLDERSVRKAADGTRLVPVRTFEIAGVVVEYDWAANQTRIRSGDREALVVPGAKRVEISIAAQMLRAWQGPYLVLENPVSTGKRGHATPTGSFKAQSRERMRYSRLYNNSPMPFSVQINGHVFIHGYKSVPRYPASHGCVRMPLWGENAAKSFFEWVDIGTPIHVVHQFSKPALA
jgi:lipoprotein-anchoring transpeptidase ErfK/SrfK